MTAEEYGQHIVEALDKIESLTFLNKILNYVMMYRVRNKTFANIKAL